MKMKKNNLIFAVLTFALVFVSCVPETNLQTTVIDFENVTLNSDSIWNGSDLTGSLVLGDVAFKNHYNAQWGSWSGFAASSKTDTKTIGYANQYSTIAGSGALNSKKFGLLYGSTSFTSKANIDGNYTINSIMLTNSTYTYLDVKEGSDFSKKFVANDWYKVILNGYLNKANTGTVEYYLADFRDGKSFISNTWTKVDLKALGKVDSVAISFDSSDKAQFGMNTPAYVCIDNIEFTQTISTKE